MATAVNARAVYNFESQGIDDFSSASTGGSIVTTNPIGKLTHSLQLTNGDSWTSRAATASEHIYTCFHVRVSALPSAGDKVFFAALDGGTCWTLEVNSSGQVIVNDSAGGAPEFTSATNTFQAATIYTCVAVWKHDNSGTLKIWWFPADGTPVQLCSLTGKDLLASAGTVKSKHLQGYVANQQVYDGAWYEDVKTTGLHADLDPPPLEFRVLGPLSNNTNTSTTSDWGANGSAGKWSDISTIPYDDALTVTFTSKTKGGISCDGTSLNGPKGNSDFDNAVIGCCWMFRAKKTGLGTKKAWMGANATASVDGTSISNTIGKTTFDYDYSYGSKLGDSPAAGCPTVDQYLQFGLRREAGFSSQGMICSTMYGLVHHEEAATVAAGPLVGRDGRLHSKVGGGLIGS